MDIFSEFIKLLEDGGFVMPPLVFCAFLLWYGLGYRYWVLKEQKPGSVRDLIYRFNTEKNVSPRHPIEHAINLGLAVQKTEVTHLDRHLDELFFPYIQEVRRYSSPIKAVVIVSPLLGLLGTVTGMIETFDSLADMALFTQSGGIAGGISQALITTQMGLAVAIPGVLFQGILNRKQRQFETDLAQVKRLLCSQAKKEN